MASFMEAAQIALDGQEIAQVQVIAGSTKHEFNIQPATIHWTDNVLAASGQLFRHKDGVADEPIRYSIKIAYGKDRIWFNEAIAIGHTSKWTDIALDIVHALIDRIHLLGMPLAVAVAPLQDAAAREIDTLLQKTEFSERWDLFAAGIVDAIVVKLLARWPHFVGPHAKNPHDWCWCGEFHQHTHRAAAM